ncbi:tetratricopeptide repeat protein [Tateyamaria omphalii]|uniref:Sel1 repeat family protein n=1 Tax=Tateyamaria omphalii TaxID=299262 RepID=A0A1P8N1Y4_9RHOB|nr:SEL1-like repeat protein [Tateyamaria omphalii]APX14302.1 hypothetical protein BWR18_20875 [Tateyamaria omphalii]
MIGIRLLKLGIAVVFFVFASIGVAQPRLSLTDLTNAAQAGDVSAQTELGLRSLTGDGTLQDHSAAAQWFARAAEAGDAEAQNQLGRLYHTGRGVARDTGAALRWLEAAATSGDPVYLFDLASVLESEAGETNLTRAAGLYTAGAQAGHLPSTISLGVLYQKGAGVPQDFAEAKRLYQIGLDSGHPRAQNNLGLLYVRGDGVEQDYFRAAELFAAAAEQGLTQAMTNLGVLYENGFGVPQDAARADALYRMSGTAAQQAVRGAGGFQYDPRLAPLPQSEEALQILVDAAAADDPVARFQMGWLLVSAVDASFDDIRAARTHFESAAERGHGPSMANLALMYFRGQGAPQDFVLGHMWMLMAQRAGTVNPTLTELFANTATPEQINEAETRGKAFLEKNGMMIMP